MRFVSTCLLGVLLATPALADESADHYQQGIVFKQAGKLPEAARELELAVKLRGNEAVYHYSLGVVYKMQNRFVDAARELERATQLSPKASDSHSSLGVVYYRLGRIDDAARELELALRLDPNDATAHQSLGVICRQRKQYDKALTHLARAVELAPGNAVALSNLAIAERNAGKVELAEKHIRQAIALKPKQADLYYNLCVIYRHQYRLESAIPECEKAASLDPRLGSAHNDLAMFYTKLGRKPEAIASWNRYLHLIAEDNPGEADIIRRLIRELGGTPESAEVGFDPKLRRDEQTGQVLADAQCPAGMAMDTIKGRCEKQARRSQAVTLVTASGTTKEQAKAHYINGARLYDHDKFEEALVEFQTANQLKPDPALVYNMGQCYRMLGQRESAVGNYRRYLSMVPDSPVRERIERYISQGK